MLEHRFFNKLLSDVFVEQTVTTLASYPHTFQVHCKVTHLGSDLHTDAQQEFPAVYVNSEYNRFVYYGGTNPWTNEPLSVTQFQLLGDPGFLLYVPEHWGAHVNTQNVGLTIYVPSQYPYVSGFDSPGDGTNYFLPFTMLTFGPNFTFEGDFYAIAGDYGSARQIVYDLHQKLGLAPNIFAALGSTDVPSPGSTLSGPVTVGGWAFSANANLASVEILVDKMVDGTASYGSPRPGVADFPCARKYWVLLFVGHDEVRERASHFECASSGRDWHCVDIFGCCRHNFQLNRPPITNVQVS